MKFAAAALIGSVSACPIQDGVETIYHMLLSNFDRPKSCPAIEEPRPLLHNAIMRFKQASYMGFVKGMYQSDYDIIDDQCFGAWTDAAFDAVEHLGQKVVHDPLHISRTDIKGTFDNVVDAIYHNWWVCDIDKVIDDSYDWCLTNPGKCIYMEDLEFTVYDNLMPILGSMFNLYKIAMEDTTCYSPQQRFDQVYGVSEVLGQLTHSVGGFDYKWDKDAKRMKFNMNFEKELTEALKPYEDSDIFALMFPDFIDFFQPIEDFFNSLFHPVVLKKKTNNVHHLNKRPVHHDLANSVDS